MQKEELSRENIFNFAVIVAALGYFVDIYDLTLFSIVRIQSLEALGFSGSQLTDKGILLINMQMAGMLVGGIIWGILGDKRGRVSVLFGSILLYSIANIANGMVNDINMYAGLRFMAGVGLAGELGAGITLVSETISKKNRGYGTMVVVVLGALGAVLASLIGRQFEWRIAYYVGGGLGLALLFLRIGTFESGMFSRIKESTVKKGDFLYLFRDRRRFLKYLNCILIGVPIWFVIGILVTFSKELGEELGLSAPVDVSKAVMYAYIGLSAGDLASGFLSQLWQSRKKVVYLFLALTTALLLSYISAQGLSISAFYIMCFFLGVSAGYWAIFVTIAAEQFGTNVRATVTTTVPNFVRGAVVPITFSFQALIPYMGMLYSALTVGLASIALALIAGLSIKESFHEELNYIEEIS